MTLLRDMLHLTPAALGGASLAPLDDLAGSARGQLKITAIKALQYMSGPLSRVLIKIETDAGISGYGPCGGTGPLARQAIALLEGPRLPHLGLIGKDPLAIGVHFHNMFHAYRQRYRLTRIFSGIDMALWDLAGKALNLPVSRLLGGTFRERIPLYSHCTGGDYFSREEWRQRADSMIHDPHGFKAYKIDIHHALGVPMQQYTPSIGAQGAAKVRRAYELAREALGDGIDIIVHCHAELDLPSAVAVAKAIEPIKPLFYEDPLDPTYSVSWAALRRSTNLEIMTGEVLELVDGVLPFLENRAIDVLQPDLMNAGGITGTKRIADLAELYRVPVCLHNVSGYALNMASQQFSAAVFNCPRLECTRNGDEAPEAASNAPVIEDGHMLVSQRPGLGIDLDQDYLKAHRVEGEPWWG